MADSISFIGAKTVRNQTGNQITLLRPKRGGDTHKIKSWWHKGRNAVYIECALFSVALDNATTVQLAIPLAETTRVKITSDGDGNFSFHKDFIGIDRAAVIDPTNGSVIIEYQFPKISGGSILKRTIGNLPTPPENVVVAPSPAPAPAPTPSPAPTVPFADQVAAADLSVAVTVADTGNGDKYQIDGVEQDGIAGIPGVTIHFDLSDASVSGHPLKIYADAGKVTEVTVGVEQQGDDLLFSPPIAGTFYYQCENHADMGGQIVIS